MSQPVILKVYANIYPADSSIYNTLAEAASSCICAEEDHAPVVQFEDEIVRISFEGIYFPVEETVAAIRSSLTPAMQGKLDILNLEEWTIIRLEFANGLIREHPARSLNHVMDYNGF